MQQDCVVQRDRSRVTCLKETCWDVVLVKRGVERRVFLIGETRREVRRRAGKIRAYLPTEPPSVAQVEAGLKGIDWC
jgi:hypothetical protein